MDIKPLSNRVLLKVKNKEEKKVGGILLPENSKQKSYQGEVVAVGPGKRYQDQIIPMTVQVGDTVIYKEYAGSELDVDQEGTYIILSEDDIYAIVK